MKYDNQGWGSGDHNFVIIWPNLSVMVDMVNPNFFKTISTILDFSIVETVGIC
jgi:hypothetical protein